jgi:hypothetical protein
MSIKRTKTLSTIRTLIVALYTYQFFDQKNIKRDLGESN